MDKKYCPKCGFLLRTEEVIDGDNWLIQEYCHRCGRRFDIVAKNWNFPPKKSKGTELMRKKIPSFKDRRSKETMDFTNRYKLLTKEITREILDKLIKLTDILSIKYIANFCGEKDIVIKSILNGKLKKIHKDLYDQLDILFLETFSNWNEIPSDPDTWTACTTSNCIFRRVCKRKQIPPNKDRTTIQPNPSKHLNGLCKFLMR